MIHTLISDCYLYKVHRHRTAFEIRMVGQRRAYILICLFMMAITTATILFIVYGK